MTETAAPRLVPIHVPDGVLDDLGVRLKATRWPRDAGNEDGYYGVLLAYLRELVEYWIDGYDWRAAEAEINAYQHYRVDVGGVPVHFMRRPGVGPDPTPLILSHGWPWTFWHWSKVIDPLADPGAFGGDPAEAFDVIVPSLPGFGFSTPLTGHPDMNFWKIADVWHELMTGVLGHRKYAAAGCDVGALVHLAAHVLDPATLGYGLTDSPAGMLAWILKRWAAWSDDHGDIESVFTKDDLLTHATIFWAGDAIASSIRTYANNNRYPWRPSHDRRPVVRRPPASPSSATRTRPAGRALPEQ